MSIGDLLVFMIVGLEISATAYGYVRLEEAGMISDGRDHRHTPTDDGYHYSILDGGLITDGGRRVGGIYQISDDENNQQTKDGENYKIPDGSGNQKIDNDGDYYPTDGNQLPDGEGSHPSGDEGDYNFPNSNMFPEGGKSQQTANVDKYYQIEEGEAYHLQSKRDEGVQLMDDEEDYDQVLMGNLGSDARGDNYLFSDDGGNHGLAFGEDSDLSYYRQNRKLVPDEVDGWLTPAYDMSRSVDDRMLKSVVFRTHQKLISVTKKRSIGILDKQVEVRYGQRLCVMSTLCGLANNRYGGSYILIKFQAKQATELPTFKMSLSECKTNEIMDKPVDVKDRATPLQVTVFWEAVFPDLVTESRGTFNYRIIACQDNTTLYKPGVGFSLDVKDGSILPSVSGNDVPTTLLDAAGYV